MKRIYYLFFALLALAGCRKDAFNGAAPVIVFDQEKLEAVVDADLQISGVITAGNGIAEFSIVNEAYGVNRHETFADGRQPAEYGFITEFSVPSGLKTDQEIVVSVTDAAGRTAQNSLKVFFLADETAPSVNLTASALIYPDAVSGALHTILRLLLRTIRSLTI